jgi:hypothetical protein
MSYMYSEAQIRDRFGDEALNYLKDKNRGGTNSEKGNTYENFFAVYQLALLAQQVIEQNEVIYLASQILAFVDDLVRAYSRVVGGINLCFMNMWK